MNRELKRAQSQHVGDRAAEVVEKQRASESGSSIVMSMIVLVPPERIPKNLREKATRVRATRGGKASAKLDAKLDLYDVREAERRLSDSADQMKPFKKSR